MIHVGTTRVLVIHEQSVGHISLKNIGLDVCKVTTAQYGFRPTLGLLSCTRVIKDWTAISSTKCCQVAGLIQKVSRSFSKASSLCEEDSSEHSVHCYFLYKENEWTNECVPRFSPRPDKKACEPGQNQPTARYSGLIPRLFHLGEGRAWEHIQWFIHSLIIWSFYLESLSVTYGDECGSGCYKPFPMRWCMHKEVFPHEMILLLWGSYIFTKIKELLMKIYLS